MVRWKKTYQRIDGRVRVVDELIEDSDDEGSNETSEQDDRSDVIVVEDDTNESDERQPQNTDQPDQDQAEPPERQQSPDQCTICYDAEPNFKTSCGHSFCQPCISIWRRNYQANVAIRGLTLTYTCPLCRVPLRDATTPGPAHAGRTRPRRRRRRQNGNGEPRAPRSVRETRERELRGSRERQLRGLRETQPAERVRQIVARRPSRRSLEVSLNLLSTRVARSQDGGTWLKLDDIVFRDADFRGGYVQANTGRISLSVPFYFAETLREIQPITYN